MTKLSARTDRTHNRPARQHRRRRSGLRRPTGAWLVAPALLAGGVATAVTLSLTVAPSTASMQLTRGEGHGRGLGQNGAYDYARKGWTVDQILEHYYPGTTRGHIAPLDLDVRLQGQDNRNLDVYSTTGMIVAGKRLGPNQAAHLAATPDGGADVTITTGCAGPVIFQAHSASPWVDPVNRAVGRPAAEHLRLCAGDKPYRGSLGVALENGAPRVVNHVNMEDYLRGVVPSEMAANWADNGGGAALQAQAVAARSYSATEQRYPYADTCDSTDCQAYGGSSVEDPRTDQAVASTRNLVVMSGGKVAHTEYSASSDADGQAEDKLAVAPPPVTGQGGLLPGLLGSAPSQQSPLAINAAAPGTSPIDAKWQQMGGPGGTLGQPIGPELPLPKKVGGTFRVFSGGVVVDQPLVGTQVVSFAQLQTLLAK